MRRTAPVLIMLLSLGACASDDEQSTTDDAAASSSGTTSGGDIVSPDGSSGGDETGDTGGSDDGFGLSVGPDDDTTDTDARPQGLDESFESVLIGEQPGEPWSDVVSRIDDPSVVSPTAVVIATDDPDGESTQALQLTDAIGTSQGLLAPISDGNRHQVAANVRIDQFSDATTGTTWPIAVGFTQDDDTGDLNDDPHAVVMVAADGTWHLQIKNGSVGANVLDAAIPAAAVEEGRWYRVMLEVDADQGSFHALVFDPTTDESLGEHTVFVPGWDIDFGRYDALAFYDGEYDTEDSTQGGQASIDDVLYEPTFEG
ncbi:MAG: hypothetical protein AAF799_32800 [Myxococcota bacterium]